MNLFNGDAIQFVLYFIVPGVIAIIAHDSMAAAGRRNWQDMTLALITYGVINLLIFSLLSLLIQFLPVFQIPLLIVPQKVNGTALVFLDIIIPIGMAWLSVVVPRSRFIQRFFRGLFLGPDPSPWDFVFSNRYKCYCLLFHFNDGGTLAGIYGANSRVSNFPHPKEVYVERLCSIDAQGNIGDPVPGSTGAFIAMDGCKFVEFIELKAQRLPLIQRRNLWQKISSLLKVGVTVTLIRPFSKFSKGLSSKSSKIQKFYAKAMDHSSSPPQMPSQSATVAPMSQVQEQPVQQLPLSQPPLQQLIQGQQVQAAPPPIPNNSKEKTAN